MPDLYTNARPFYDVTFPSSGDSFSIANFKNAFQGLGFMDFIPGQPRAHNPADMRIMVRGRDASSFYNPVYAGDANQHLFIGSGDSAIFTAPVSNPRLDIVYWTASGDIRTVTGTEAANPTLPTLAPSGDTRIPICAIYHKTTAAKIVNFEDKDSNSGDSYIYQDLRPFLRAAGMGGISLTSISPVNPTGDNAVGTAVTAARADHAHQGVHAVRVVGQSNLYGDIEFAGSGDTRLFQSGNRITIGSSSDANILELVTGTYVGNLTDNRNITIGFADTSIIPTFVMVKSKTFGEVAFWRSSANIGDEAQGFGGDNSQVDQIQSFSANTFQIGATTQVNRDATTFIYNAWGKA